MTQAQRQQQQIDLAQVFEALARPLGLVDSPERRADLQRYIDSARIHLERAVFDLLSSVVNTFNDAGTGARGRLEYEGGVLNLVVEPTEDEASAEPEQPFSIEGDMEKVTIRIPADLKELIDRAASVRGVSVNRFYIGELARSISRQVREQVREDVREARREGRHERRHGGGSSLRGYVGED